MAWQTLKNTFCALGCLPQQDSGSGIHLLSATRLLSWSWYVKLSLWYTGSFHLQCPCCDLCKLSLFSFLRSWHVFLKLLHHLTCSLLEIPFTGKVLESCITIVRQSIENETGRKDVYCSFKKHHLRITRSDLRKIPNTPKVNSWYYYMSKQKIFFLEVP